MKIPFLSFETRNKSIRSSTMLAFEKFFDSKWYILGDSVKDFENSYSEFNKVSHTVGVSNGLDALHLALESLGVGIGDEVIVPSNTFITTVMAIKYTGAKPIFVEPKQTTFNIDETLIEEKINKKTKVIMPVHLYGQACNMDAIMTIANKHNLFVIEDNAQSQGAKWNGKLTGSFGQINGTSFYPGKNLGALGDAGAVTTNDKTLAERVKELRNYGSSKKYHHDIHGYNKRLDECQASFLSISLKHLERWNTQRRAIANWYYEALKDIDPIQLPQISEESTHVFHLFVIQTPQRELLQDYLEKEGVSTLIHYPIPPHLQKCYSDLGYKKGDFPIAEKLADTVLSLPLWIGMTKEHVLYVAETIENFFIEN